MEYEELANKEKEEINIIDLRNEVVSIFTYYYYISNAYFILESIINKNDIETIFTIEYAPQSNNNDIYILNFDNSKKEYIIKAYLKKANNDKHKEQLKDILNLINNFLSKYLYYKEFEFFPLNQPIDFEKNLTLYYNYLLYSLYEHAIEVRNENNIIFRFWKLMNYYLLQFLHNLIFDNYFDKQIPIDKNITELIELLFFCLSCNLGATFIDITKYIHLENSLNEKFIDEISAWALLDSINSNYKLIMESYFNENKDKIVVKYKKNNNIIIELKYDDYSENLISLTNNAQFFTGLYTCIKFEKFQTHNFFDIKDIKYLFYLIEHILSSNLFKEIYDNFNNISNITDFYFSQKVNIKDFIKRIKFLPFDTKYFKKYALTNKKTLSILLSGYPQNSITSMLDYFFNRIIELSLRVVSLIQESAHFLKSANAIITNGKVSRNTSNENEDCKDAEAGFLIEEILFGWKNRGNYKLDLKRFNLPKNMACKNESILKKKIDLSSALVLLNPDNYSKDLKYFRKKIFESKKEDLKSFDFSNYKGEYRQYLESILKDINLIRDNWDNNISINASKDCLNELSVEYFGSDHRIK